MRKFLIIFITFLSGLHLCAWDEAYFQEQFMKSRIGSCKPKLLRSLASTDSKDPNLKDPNLKKSLNLKSFSKFRKKQDKKLASVDVDKDGRADCKRSFHKKSKQVKREVCDMNYDGVVDFISEFDRNGLPVKELINRDKDPFFEVAVLCKKVDAEPGLAICKKSVDILDQNKRTESMYLYRSSTKVLAKYYKKLLFSKKQSRGVASTKKLRFNEEELPIGHSYDWALERIIKSYKEQKEKVSDPDQKAILDERKTLFENKLKAFKQETKPYMKYFMSFETYIPNTYDSCLEDGRNSCQHTVNYEAIGMKEDRESFTQCMNYTFHFCNDDRGKSEGKHCFNCFSDEEYIDIFMDVWYEENQDFGEAPEGFSYLGKEEVLIHDSCKPYVDIEELSVEDSNRCWMEMTYEEKEKVRDENYKEMLLTHDRLVVNSKIEGLRLLRALRPTLYSEYMSHLDGTSRAQPKGVPKSWKVKSKEIRKNAESFGRKYIDEKEDPRIKIFCNNSKENVVEEVPTNMGFPVFQKGVVYSHPVISLNPRALAYHKKSPYRGQTPKEAVNNFIRDELSHAFAHVLNHGHGYPRKITKGPNKGMWRCNWSPEPDYAYMCEDKICGRDSGAHNNPHAITCGAKAGAHIDYENGLDQKEGYGVGMRREQNLGLNKFGVEAVPENCGY